jgi:hypothetical protein
VNEPLERLLVTIEGSAELLRQELQKGGTSVQQFARDTDSKLGKVESTFKRMGSTLRSTLAVFGVGFGATALVRFAGSAIDTADAIGEAARAAGFGAERFQRLQFVFGQNGVEAQEFEAAMRTLNTRLGQFVTTGAGPAAKAIEQLGLKQKIASGEISTSEQLFDAIVAALGNVDSASQRAALAAAFFSRELGAKMQDTLGRGTQSIEAAAAAVRGVFSDEASRRADEINDKYNELSKTIGVTLKSAIISVAGPLVELADALSKAITPDAAKTLANNNVRALEIVRAIRDMEAHPTFGGLNERRLGESSEEAIARLRQELDALSASTRALTPPSRTAPVTAGGIDLEETDAARRARQRLETLKEIEVTARRIASIEDVRAQRRSLGLNSFSRDGLLTDVTTGGASRVTDASEIFAARRAARARLGMNESPFNEATLERMREYGEATEKARDRQRGLADAIAASFESRGMEALLSGKPRDAIRGFAKDLAELVIRITVLQPLAEKLAATLSKIGKGDGDKKSGSGIVDVLGGILGFAGGGRPPVGRASLVGERGPELWVPDVPGRVYTMAQASRLAGAGGAVIHQSFYNQIGLPPQWDAQLTGVAHMAAQAAYEAVMGSLGPQR